MPSSEILTDFFLKEKNQNTTKYNKGHFNNSN